MEAVPALLITALEPETKRPCIRIKARIKIQGEQQSLTPIVEAVRPYQAYCETVTSSRSQTPDIFTTPPTHSEPFLPTQTPRTPRTHTYTARIISRKANTPSSYGAARLQDVAVLDTSKGNSNERDVAARRDLSEGYLPVRRSTPPRSSHSDMVADRMSRNRTPSLSQVRQANLLPQTKSHHTPRKQKRYGRMEYHPLPPLPPSPPESPTPLADDERISARTMVNFSRGDISPKSLQVQEQTKASHRSWGNLLVSTPGPPSSAPDVKLGSIQAEDERPNSKASRRTVTFADDTTIPSRRSWPVHHSHTPDRTLRQSKSFCTEAEIPSSLRLSRSHDSLLAAKPVSKDNVGTNAARRTAPKDFGHKYPFGQRPAPRTAPPVSLERCSNSNYNPRLSTSKAQYRGLASLPRPLPSSLRIAQPQAGPRQPPWGSLGHLEEQRERRLDARERNQAKQFRTAALSEATTLAETDVYGKDRMKKEVEEYREQAVSVYPDMAFDGSAGKGGRGCCCVVM